MCVPVGQFMKKFFNLRFYETNGISGFVNNSGGIVLKNDFNFLFEKNTVSLKKNAFSLVWRTGDSNRI